MKVPSQVRIYIMILYQFDLLVQILTSFFVCFLLRFFSFFPLSLSLSLSFSFFVDPLGEAFY